MGQMDYHAFWIYIRENIADYFDDIQLSDLEITHQKKNNGVEKTQLFIREEGKYYGTAIDLEAFYQRYLAGSDLEMILEDISDVFFTNMSLPEDIHVNDFVVYEKVQNLIYLQAVNYEANKERLQFMPYIRKLDLALILKIHIPCDCGCCFNAEVSWSMVEAWQVDTEHLFFQAIKNTERLFPPVWESMISMAEAYLSIDEEIFDTDTLPLYVLTNREKHHGAMVVFYPGFLKTFAEILGSDLYLMPSSIHEMMAVPAEEPMDPQNLKAIVCEVNDAAVEPEQRLGEHVYLFCREKNDLEIIA